MNLEDFIATGLPALGAIVAIAIFLWRRYQNLERRFREIELRLIELDHRGQMTREAMQGTDDMHLLQINGNRELIEHRTQRFTESLKAVEARLCKDIEQIQAFLDKTTDFTIRGRDLH